MAGARQDVGFVEDLGDMLRTLAANEAHAVADAIYTAALGKILAIEAGGLFADVQIYPKMYELDDDGNRVAVSVPPLPHVRVLRPGGGGVTLDWDIGIGSEVLVVWTKLDSNATIESGDEEDPDNVAQHDISFAVCIPFCWKAGTLPTLGVARRTDPVNAAPTPAWVAWLAAVQAVCVGINPGMPPVPVEAWTGTITAGSTKVRSS